MAAALAGTAIGVAGLAAGAATLSAAPAPSGGGWLTMELGATQRATTSKAALAYCARHPQLSRTLSRQLAAAKKARTKALTPAAKAAAAKKVALVQKKIRKAAADYKRFSCKTLQTALFCKSYAKLTRTYAKQIAAAKKARAAAKTPAAKLAATRLIVKITKQQKADRARNKKLCKADGTPIVPVGPTNPNNPKDPQTDPSDKTAPTITGRDPGAGATNVAVAGNVTVTFSEALKTVTVNPQTITLSKGGAPVSATATLAAGGTVVTVDPVQTLDAGVAYTVTVGTGVTDANGNHLAAADTWSFTTAPPVGPGGNFVSTDYRIATGAMIGASGNPRWFYQSFKGGPWQPTYADKVPAARGKLMNFRAINAIYDDENRALVPGFDPDANTNEFIKWLPTYKSLGIEAFTLGMQGGKPNYEGNLSSAIRTDGTLKPEWLDRADRVIKAADAQGMVVILSYFYKAQEAKLPGDDIIRKATVNITDWIIQQGYGNVIIEVANEYNTSGYKNPIFTTGKADSTFPGVAELVALAKSRFDGKPYRLPVGASHTRIQVPQAIRAVADVSLVHGNPFSPQEDGQMVADLVNDPTVPGPVIMNEDFNGYGTGQANVDQEKESAGNVFRNGGSWGHMWQPYTQKYPFRWAVGASEDVSGGDEANRFRAVLDGINALLQPDHAAPSIGEKLPTAGSTGVSTSASVVATFSEPMDPGSVSTATFTLTTGGVPVDARVGISPAGDHAFLTPIAPLAPNTTYTATLTGGLADSSGNPVTSGATWSFTTGAAPAAGEFHASNTDLVFEAEDYSRKTVAAGHDWFAGQSPAGSVGGALLAGPDNGFGVSGDPRGTSPSLDYDVDFAQAGSYRVWVRGYQPDGNGNSVSVSMDGLHPNVLESENMSGLPADATNFGKWIWIGKRVGSPYATIVVPTAGQHTIQVYLREDGFSFDRIELVKDSVGDDTYMPTGDGPAASPRS
jgi:hypothetical protein